MEKSYYAISFNQGPQTCPAKELAIYLAQSFIVQFVKVSGIIHEGVNKMSKYQIDFQPSQEQLIRRLKKNKNK